MSICTLCTQAINQKSPGLPCISCDNFFHAKCVNLTKTMLDLITGQTNILWKCTGCLESEEQNKSTCSGCSMIPKLIENINKLTATVTELQRQIQNSKQEVNNCNMDDIINEINDRQSRARNIIIFKMKESESPSNQEREAEDAAKAIELLKYLVPETNVENIKTVRLGRKCNDKVRPLKITLNCQNDALKLIWNKSKLKNSKYNVIISLDQTDMQRNHYKKLKAEYDDRTKNGEKLKIKYVNGVPHIMKEKN